MVKKFLEYNNLLKEFMKATFQITSNKARGYLNGQMVEDMKDHLSKIKSMEWVNYTMRMENIVVCINFRMEKKL